MTTITLISFHKNIQLLTINYLSHYIVCRNPEHPSRPSFSTIYEHYLQQSSAKILYWAPEDEQLSPAVGVPGAPLDEASKLHLDIQEKYKNLNYKF